ncbi:MAG: acyltransferase [Burkholderiales bacterium]|nr:acyltransferase [Phycisphaerae bacterium]
MKPEAHISVPQYEHQHPGLANPGQTRLLNHMPQLDGVRGLAVLMVIWWHFMPASAKQGSVAPWGAMGVGLFFTLSGFLITRILLNCRLKIEEQKSTVGAMMRQFYIRRFLRIFPLYYGVLLVLFIVNPFNYDSSVPPKVNDRVAVSTDAADLPATVLAVRSEPIVVTRDGRPKNTTIDRFDVRLDDGTTRTAEAKDIGVERGFRDRVLWHVAYLSNVRFSYWPKAGEIERHLWSLSVEEQFYLLWPLLIFLIPRSALGPLILLMVAVGPVWRAMTYAPRYLGHEWMMPGCLDLLGAGAFLAFLSLPQFGWSRLWNAAVELSGLIGIPLLIVYVTAKSLAVQSAVGAFEQVTFFGVEQTVQVGRSGWLGMGFEWTGGATYAITALASFWLIAMASRGFRGPIGHVLASAPMVYIGRISYGLYVIHMFVPHLLIYFFPQWDWVTDRGWTRFFGLSAISIVLASVSWYAFEAPINRLKRYFEYDARAARA